MTASVEVTHMAEVVCPTVVDGYKDHVLGGNFELGTVLSSDYTQLAVDLLGEVRKELEVIQDGVLDLHDALEVEGVVAHVHVFAVWLDDLFPPGTSYFVRPSTAHHQFCTAVILLVDRVI